MYKIGYTSGLAEKSSDEGKTTIKIIGEVLPKMIKKVEDCPKKPLVINKIMEITDGCFSSASCIEVKDEKSSSSSDSENNEDSEDSEDSTSEEAAQTSGSCGGGRSSKTTDTCNKSATKSSCNGGCSGGSSCSGDTASQDELTGEDIVDMFTPSEITDIIDSDCATVLEANNDAAQNFKRQYCNYRPYPECATCPYASGNVGTTSNDLTTIFSQVRDAMQALQSGQYELADHMFQCPGQLALLMSGDIEDEAKVAAANAVYAVVTLAASRGALSTYANLATEALATDFRREVMYAASDLLQSGSNIAQKKGFVNAINGILTAIGCTGNSLTRLRAGSGSSRSSRFGAGYNLAGRRSNGTKNSNTRAKTSTNAAKTSRVTGKPVNYGSTTVDTTVDSGVTPNVMGAGEIADTDDSIIPTVYESGGRKPVSAESTEKAEKALAKVSNALSSAAKASDNPISSSVKPASKSNKYTASTATTAETGKVYYRAVKDSTTASGIKYEAIATTPGEDMALLTAKYGSIYEKEDSPQAEEIVAVADNRIVSGREYFYYNPIDDEYVSLDVTPGESTENIRRKVAIKLGINKSDVKLCCRNTKDTPVSYTPTEDTVPVEDVVYYTVNSAGDFVVLDTSSGEFPVDTVVYEKTVNPVGYTSGCSELESDGAYLFDNGLMLEESVPVDICNDTLSVDTRTLVTQTHVLAEDMAQIEGLNLSVYEIKMAYILDNERNGSIMPVDVTGEVIPTILDTIANND